VGLESKHLPCRACRSVTPHELNEPASTTRGMTTELWACGVCGTLESRSYRTAASQQSSAELREDAVS
jgi:hypothetical protein